MHWFCKHVYLCLDRGNDNWLLKYDMPDIDETHQDVSWLIFSVNITITITTAAAAAFVFV